MFARGERVPISHFGYFKPPATAFAAELRKRNKRYAKEWEYINAAGVWVEVALVSLRYAMEKAPDYEQVTRMLGVAERGAKAALEVLTMRGQYFHDIVNYGLGVAQQRATIVEQQQNSVQS